MRTLQLTIAGKQISMTAQAGPQVTKKTLRYATAQAAQAALAALVAAAQGQRAAVTVTA
jgi:hypothetical protein